MVLDDIFERFARQSPVTVMVRAALEHALSPRTIDALFEQTAQRQYTRTLLFSSVVDLMATVCHALGVPAHLELHDQQNRPLVFCPGNPLLPLFG